MHVCWPLTEHPSTASQLVIRTPHACRRSERPLKQMPDFKCYSWAFSITKIYSAQMRAGTYWVMNYEAAASAASTFTRTLFAIGNGLMSHMQVCIVSLLRHHPLPPPLFFIFSRFPLLPLLSLSLALFPISLILTLHPHPTPSPYTLTLILTPIFSAGPWADPADEQDHGEGGRAHVELIILKSACTVLPASGPLHVPRWC